MRCCTLIFMAALVAALVWPARAVEAAGWSDIAVYSSTRYESHTIHGPQSDNTVTQSFNFSLKTGRRSTVISTIGHRYDLDDSESDSTIFGLTYLHGFNRRHYAALGYSNSRVYQSVDDNRLGDTFDAWRLHHVWRLLNRHHVNIDLHTGFITDTGFDNNRSWNEGIEFYGPLAHRITWRLAYQYGHSFVSDSHASNVWDIGFTGRVFRYGRVGLGYRVAELFSGPRKTRDNIWIISYNQRLR